MAPLRLSALAGALSRPRRCPLWVPFRCCASSPAAAQRPPPPESSSPPSTSASASDDGESLREAHCGSQVGHGSGGRVEMPEVRGPPLSMPFAVRALSHVSIAVPDVAHAAEHFRTLLGAQISAILEIPERGVVTVAVHVGSSCLVLMQPVSSSSQTAGDEGLQRFLAEHPQGGIHHISFTVDNLQAAKEHLEAEGVPLVRHAETRSAIHMGMRHNPTICLHPGSTSGVMCELEQVSFGRASDRFS